MAKILRSQLPVLFAKKEPAKKDGEIIKNDDGTDRMYTNFYVLLANGKYVRVKPAYTGTKEKPDRRDFDRLLDNVPLIQCLEDIE